MGIATLPQLELYWSIKHELIGQHIAGAIPLIRFLQIFCFLCLMIATSKLLLTSLDIISYSKSINVEIQLHYSLSRNLSESISIDEAMVPFKGWLFFKQYTKDKSVKHRITKSVWVGGKYVYIK